MLADGSQSHTTTVLLFYISFNSIHVRQQLIIIIHQMSFLANQTGSLCSRPRAVIWSTPTQRPNDPEHTSQGKPFVYVVHVKTECVV